MTDSPDERVWTVRRVGGEAPVLPGRREARTSGVAPGGPAWTAPERRRERSSAELAGIAALTDDPFGRIPEGAFFHAHGTRPGASTRPAPALGEGRIPLVMPLRHAPDEATLARLSTVAGAAAGPLLARWRAVWDEATQDRTETWSERLGARSLDDGRAGPDAGRSVTTISRMEAGRAGAHEASHLFALSHRDAFVPDRDPVLHALEDAAAAVALCEAGVAWAYAGSAPGRGVLHVLPMTREAGGRPRRLAAKRSHVLAGNMQSSPPYWRARAFATTCGRTMVQADDAMHAGAILHDMARQGHALAFVKHCTAKGGTWTVPLDGIGDPAQAMGRLVATMARRGIGPQACGLDAEAGFVLIQSFVRFAMEARFFVVDGRIVASTSSDRFLSPLDAHGGPGRLDPRVAVLIEPPGRPGPYDRGMARTQTERALVARMARRVRALVAACRRDPVSAAILGTAYIVDVGATGRDAEPDLIEVNRWRNAATYAADAGRLARAMVPIATWPRPPERLPNAIGALSGLLPDLDGVDLDAMIGLVARTMSTMEGK